MGVGGDFRMFAGFAVEVPFLKRHVEQCLVIHPEGEVGHPVLEKRDAHVGAMGGKINLVLVRWQARSPLRGMRARLWKKEPIR